MRSQRLAPILTLAATFAIAAPLAAIEPGPVFEPIPIPVADPLLYELEAQGVEHPVTEFWRVDDGNTVSLLWQFTTPERTDVPPAIEVPKAGAYPWYTGSSLSIVDPLAFWTGDAWASGGQEGDEFLVASDTNPTLDAKKKVVISYWWTRRNGQATPPGPGVSVDPAGNHVSIQSWPSHLYPGAEFVTWELSFGPPCPPKVTATLTSTVGTVLVKGFSVAGTCPG